MHFSFKEVMLHTNEHSSNYSSKKNTRDAVPKVTSGNSSIAFSTFNPTFAENVMELQLPPAKICLLKALSSGGVTCKQLGYGDTIDYTWYLL